MALNRQIVDIAERNIDTGFDLATGLAGREPGRGHGIAGSLLAQGAGEFLDLSGRTRTVIQSPSSEPKPVTARAEMRRKDTGPSGSASGSHRSLGEVHPPQWSPHGDPQNRSHARHRDADLTHLRFAGSAQ